MTIVDKGSDSSNPISGQNQTGSSVGPPNEEMDSDSSSWGTVSSLDVANHRISLGPVPGATDYSSSPASEKPKPSAQKDQSVNDGIAPPQKVLFPAEKICLKWQQSHRVGAGLQNLGNTCFLNSILQCLTYTPPLANYMLSYEHSKTCHEQGFCMMCIMQTHINQALSNSGSVIKPMAVINDLRRIAKHFRFGNQEDAHEFLRYTVDAMQKACLNGSTKLDRPTQATTLIHQIFGGYLRSRVKCSNCKGVSDTFEPYLDIALEIKTAQSVSKALELFVKPEQLDGENCYKCSRCKKTVPASKRFTIHRSSNVLTISLKRFANFSGGKISKDVKYSEFLDLRPFMSQQNGEPVLYTLYAVLVHTGFSCHAGHYFAYIKSCNAQWYQMNDSIVAITDIRTVLNQQAYMLFYIRSSDVKNGELIYSIPGQSSPRPAISQRVVNSKQTVSGFIGPQLPPHLIKTSGHLNGTGSLKETPSSSVVCASNVTLTRPNSAPPSTSIQNWTINRPTIPDPSKKQKITISIHNKLPARQSLVQPNLHNSSLESLSKPVPSSTITNSSAVQSTSSASTMSVATKVPKQLATSEACSKAVLNGKSKLSSSTLVPYGAESSEESDEDSKALVKENGHKKPVNGILIGSVASSLQNSCSSCQDAEKEVPQHELPKTDRVNGDKVNGAICLDNNSKDNDLKLDDSTCQTKALKTTETFFPKMNGLHGKMCATLPSVPEDKILESFKFSQVKTSSEDISITGTEKTDHSIPNDCCNSQGPFAASAPETISTKEGIVENTVARKEEDHSDIIDQHKAKKRTLGTEEERALEESADKARGPKEAKVMLKEAPLHVKGPAETVEKLGQSSLIKSDSECSSKKLSTLNITDKCQETKHSTSDYPEGQSAVDSPTKLSKVLESYSKENEGLSDNDKLGEDTERQKLQTHSPGKEKVCTTKKMEREHYCKKRRHSENEEKLDSRDSRKRRTYSSERGKQDHHYKKHHDNGSKYKLMHNERSSRSSGRYPDYRSHSREQNDKDGGWYYLPKREGSWNRERYYQDIPRRWDKGRYYYDYYPFHAPRDNRERKFSHVDREYAKPSHIYDPRSYKDYYYKTRWIHEPATKEREKRNFSSSKGDFHHCPAPPQHSEKYSSEKSAPTAGENTSSFETSCLKYEDVKDRKRRCPIGDESDSEAERERKKTLQREPSEEQKVKKHKKSKKKKKSKDKHREKGSR
ncbi:ubiquitin carboxyl-terminal hydrolase 42 isoform X2 [Alligator sinensis]|uniref:ubiquitinyl hydrolase 1 n=1 Tax=Alligator sinensis TaxID=38654 RepID=A0A3Q0HBB9_ALLSI|nr:ubiquitin carboxyl-terminal hydrolase 42 isoform X2 [Alligator sinensis]